MAKAFDKLMAGLDEVESYLAGDGEGYRVHIPDTVDVKQMRRKLHMTQAGFSRAFGFSLDAVKHWEGKRRTPEAAARAYLTVIAREPKLVMQALRRESKSPQRTTRVTTTAGHPRRVNAPRQRRSASAGV